MVRFKNRYVTVEVNPTLKSGHQLSIKSFTLHSAILSSVEQLHGEYGSAAIRAGFTAKYCNDMTRVAIIRARHGPHRLVTSALPFVKSIGKTPVTIRTLYVGATLQNCYKFIVKHQKAALRNVLPSVKSEDRRDMEGKFFNLQAVLNFSKPVQKKPDQKKMVA